jgi:putative Mn2+ efflux pump MntP
VIDSSTGPLLATAAATALLHAAIPDHWLPFVLIGRARDWSAAQTARVTLLAGILHLAVSFALALLALALGRAAVAALGETMEQATGPLLVLFGVVYAAWSWRKGGHFHPGGALLHRDDGGCEGHEGDANQEHLHYHADEALIRDKGRFSATGLAMLVGLNPCVLIVPVALSAAPHGSSAIVAVFVAYGAPTLILMVGLATLGSALTKRIRIPSAARHMEMISGLLIAVLGAVLWLLPHG